MPYRFMATLVPLETWTCGYGPTRLTPPRFGAPCNDSGLGRIDEQDFCSDDLVVQIGVIPNRIDILTRIDGVGFEEAWQDHECIEIDGLRVPVISKRCLILNKKATGRLRDPADVALLENEG